MASAPDLRRGLQARLEAAVSGELTQRLARARNLGRPGMGFLARSERDEKREAATEARRSGELRFVDAPYEELVRRVVARSRSPAASPSRRGPHGAVSRQLPAADGRRAGPVRPPRSRIELTHDRRRRSSSEHPSARAGSFTFRGREAAIGRAIERADQVMAQAPPTTQIAQWGLTPRATAGPERARARHAASQNAQRSQRSCRRSTSSCERVASLR